MYLVKLNIMGIILFILGFLLGFILDIIRGTGGSEKVFAFFLVIVSTLSFILFLKGTYKVFLVFNPQLTKLLLFLFTIILAILQLLLCYVCSVVIGLYVVAPIMIKLGYHVTMP